MTQSCSVVNRRRFLSGCACACAGCAAAGALPGFAPSSALADTPRRNGKPRIRLVFCEIHKGSAGWPNVGYDFDARRRQIVDALTQGCPDVDFRAAQVVDDPAQLDNLVKNDAEVDGYLVFLTGLPWRLDVMKLLSTGKPSLLADNLFGGSGLFLAITPRIKDSGKPIDWVSSSKDQDLVASARQFGLLSSGKTADDVAKAFRATRRKRTPFPSQGSPKTDALPTPDLGEALAKLKETKLLVVGGGWGGDAFRTAARQVLGVTIVPIEFKELAAAHAAADRDQGKHWADKWIETAQEVVEPKREEIEKSGVMYVAMKALIEKHQAAGISVNCLGGFYGGHISAYPCLGFRQLNDDGLVGGCEADQMSALTMAVCGAMVGRPGFISDPVIDTSKSQIIYAHCVAPTKPFGPSGPASPFRIRTHSEDRKGAAVQSLLPEGFMTTTLEIDPTTRGVLFHQAVSAGNNPSDMACRTKLEGVVQGSVEKLTEGWRKGWHRVTCYGDLKPHVAELCDRLKLKLVEEA